MSNTEPPESPFDRMAERRRIMMSRPPALAWPHIEILIDGNRFIRPQILTVESYHYCGESRVVADGWFVVPTDEELGNYRPGVILDIVDKKRGIVFPAIVTIAYPEGDDRYIVSFATYGERYGKDTAAA